MNSIETIPTTTPTQTPTETHEQYLNRCVTAIKVGILRFLYNMEHKNQSIVLVDELFKEQEYLLQRAREDKERIEKELAQNVNAIGLKHQIDFMVQMLEHAAVTLNNMKNHLQLIQ
jgi:hypothetical protein